MATKSLKDYGLDNCFETLDLIKSPYKTFMFCDPKRKETNTCKEVAAAWLSGGTRVILIKAGPPKASVHPARVIAAQRMINSFETKRKKKTRVFKIKDVKNLVSIEIGTRYLGYVEATMFLSIVRAKLGFATRLDKIVVDVKNEQLVRQAIDGNFMENFREVFYEVEQAEEDGGIAEITEAMLKLRKFAQRLS